MSEVIVENTPLQHVVKNVHKCMDKGLIRECNILYNPIILHAGLGCPTTTTVSPSIVVLLHIIIYHSVFTMRDFGSAKTTWISEFLVFRYSPTPVIHQCMSGGASKWQYAVKMYEILTLSHA